jgi:nucleotide-binding universal stress UspA family protein
MFLRPMCGAASLALMVGVADASVREPSPATALRPHASSTAPRERAAMMPASLRVTPPLLGSARQRANESRAVAAPAPEERHEGAPPSKALALLSALGAMLLVIGRRRHPE